MFIKHLIGSRAGEIEDVQFEGARAKVLAGQAEDVYDTLGLTKAPAPAIIFPAGVAPTILAPAVESNRVDDMRVEAKRKRRQ